MAFSGLLVTEIFCSIQGETSLSGVPFTFVRLTGCNLRCTYCDSTYAFKGGKKMNIEEVIAAVQAYFPKQVLLTGGEPLLQRNTLELCKRLAAQGYTVSIETHGEADISSYRDFRIVMDIKTPGSGMHRKGFLKNLQWLKPEDEIKIVLTSKADYRFARELLPNLPKNIPILFSGVMENAQAPGKVEGITLQWLAEQILKDHLNVRMQTQLHKLIWGSEKSGV